MPESSITKIGNICEKELLSIFFSLTARSNEEKGLFLCAPLSRLTETSE